jgi:nicotinamidase-related amidase
MNILVVVDMQKDFTSGILGSQEAIKIVPKVAETIKKYLNQGDLVYFTLDTHEENYLETQEGKQLPVPHCIKGTEGWEMEDLIRELADEVAKHQTQTIFFEKNGFGSEPLARYIRNTVPEGEPINILLAGLCTDICVLTNAVLLKVFMPEAIITVNSELCAGVSPKSHQTALDAMEMCQIIIEKDY